MVEYHGLVVLFDGQLLRVENVNLDLMLFGELVDEVVAAISDVAEVPTIIDLLCVEPTSNSYQPVSDDEDVKKMVNQYQGFKEIHTAVGMELFHSQVTQDYMIMDGVEEDGKEADEVEEEDDCNWPEEEQEWGRNQYETDEVYNGSESDKSSTENSNELSKFQSKDESGMRTVCV